MKGEPFGGVLAKPPRKAAEDKSTKRGRYLARRKCREAVYRRERMKCQRCGKLTKHPRECYPTDPDMAHVNEPSLRSHLADPTDPNQCELVCGECHFTPAGEHCPTAERRETLLALAEKAARRKREAKA